MSDDTLEVKTAIAFNKWRPPNFAMIAKDPSQRQVENMAISIERLDQPALDALAEAWLDDLYKRAGKRNPFQLPATP